ncbi:Uncharacterised protein r2_g4296 [Pycnogonum litorale]
MRFSRLDLDASNVENVSTDALYGQARVLTHLRLRCLSTGLEFVKYLGNLVYFSTMNPKYASCKTAGVTLAESLFSNANLHRLSHMELLTSSNIENGAFSGLKNLNVLKIHCKEVNNCYNNISKVIGSNSMLKSITLRNLDSQAAIIPQEFLSSLPDGTKVDMSGSKISKLNESVITIAIKNNLRIKLNDNNIKCGCELKFAALYKKLSSNKALLEGTCQWNNKYGQYRRYGSSSQSYNLMDIWDNSNFKSRCNP